MLERGQRLGRSSLRRDHSPASRAARVSFRSLSIAGAFANALGSFAEIGGWLGALDRLGPPLASAMALALAPWLEGVAIQGDPVRIYARLAAWAFAGVLALVYAFRRVELRG